MLRKLGLALTGLLILSVQIASAQENPICSAKPQQPLLSQQFFSKLKNSGRYNQFSDRLWFEKPDDYPRVDESPVWPGVTTPLKPFFSLDPQADARRADAQPIIPDEKRLSYWGYRHKSLHDRGIIDQILKNANSECCGGTDSGECRVSKMNTVTREALIDGVWCPITPKTAIVAVEGLDSDEDVVVCASRYKNIDTHCSSTYCIGTGTKM